MALVVLLLVFKEGDSALQSGLLLVQLIGLQWAGATIAFFAVLGQTARVARNRAIVRAGAGKRANTSREAVL